MSKGEQSRIPQKEIETQSNNGECQSIFEEHEVVDRESARDKE
jgi:hypothetical protein